METAKEFDQFFKQIELKSIKKIKLSGEPQLEAKPANGGIFQFQKIINKQAFHENVKYEELADFLFKKLNQKNINLTVHCKSNIYSFKISKGGKLLFNKSASESKTPDVQKFILPTSIPVFRHLGLVNADGKIIDRMKAKFEQIARFCELAVDAIADRKEIKIIDCGCGKAYLSFALYHYLTFDLNVKTYMHGTDLKSEVIGELKALAKSYNYVGLTFSNADIKKLDLSEFDMMISLHACDKATDYSLFNAALGNVDTILCVPCCQQEMNATLSSDSLPIFSRYGLVKERISAMLTDAVRASILTAFGYRVKIVEIVDFEHSPKNLLIKAQKGDVSKMTRIAAFNEVQAVLKEFNTTNELFTLSKDILKNGLSI